MEKSEAIDFFGGPEQTAIACGITGQAVRAWPDTLTKGLTRQVLGSAILRDGIRGYRRARSTFGEDFKPETS